MLPFAPISKAKSDVSCQSGTVGIVSAVPSLGIMCLYLPFKSFYAKNKTSSIKLWGNPPTLGTKNLPDSRSYCPRVT